MNLIKCKCGELRIPEDMCTDGSCIFCLNPDFTDNEDDVVQPEDFDLSGIADGYVADEDDEEGHDW